MQFTPQQLGGYKGYSRGVLVGNWSEDVQVMEDKMKTFQESKRAGGGPRNAALAELPVAPAPADGYVPYNMVLQLSSPANGDAMLVVDPAVKARPKPNRCILTVQVPQKIPLARSGWVLRHVPRNGATAPTLPTNVGHDTYGVGGLGATRMKDPKINRAIVHYGDTLRIVNQYACPDGFLSVSSAKCTAQDQSKGGKQPTTAMLGDSIEADFIVEAAKLPGEAAVDPASLVGKPVPLDGTVVFRHAQTNTPLFVDPKARLPTVQGLEQEVCCFLEKPGGPGIRRALPGEGNFFIIRMARPGAPYQPPPTPNADAMSRIRAKIVERGGAEGFRGLIRTFRIVDDDGNRKLSRRELREGMETYGIVLSTGELDYVFATFDRNGDGVITITEFLRTVRGGLNRRRTELVREAFRRLDKDGSGVATFEEFKQAYGKGLPRHPQVVSGEMTEREVLELFMAHWGDRDGDGSVTIREFLEYYADISAGIDSDDYFELMLRNAWHMSGGEGVCENTSCKRVLVVWRDGTQEVVELIDDLGVDVTDTKAVEAKLRQQGIVGFERVELHS